MTSPHDAMAEELRATRADLSKERRIRGLQNEANMRFRPCSDHNGKVALGYQQWECQWCRAERAERQAERSAEELRQCKARVSELEAKEADYDDLHAEWSKACRAVSDFVIVSRDRVEREQRREQLLRECLAALASPEVMAATWMEESRLRARIRSEIGEPE